jgi:hypothetical protein
MKSPTRTVPPTVIENTVFFVKWMCVCVFIYSTFITLDIIQSTWLPYGPYVFLAPMGIMYGLGFVSIKMETANSICMIFSIVMAMMPRLNSGFFHRMYNMVVIFGALLITGVFILISFDDIYLRIYSLNYDRLLKYHLKHSITK